MLKKLALCFALLALPAMTSAEEYMCDTTSFGNDGWIPPKIFLSYDPKTDRAFAYDGILASVSKKPVEVKWKRRSETSYQFNWTTNDVKMSNDGSSTVSHRVILFLDRMTFSMGGQLHGYDNTIRGSGTCKRVG